MQGRELKLAEREKVISALSASVASGCATCLQYHRKIARKIHISNNEILEVVNIALKIRKNADKFTRGDLDSALEKEYVDVDNNCSNNCSCNQIINDKSEDYGSN
ncbi:MAG: carboxymuconolactone decarboxylase family protein [Candidatus Kariarchaeaceae archaeon]|jgi:AhpD family alkylhydroperoxidase